MGVIPVAVLALCVLMSGCSSGNGSGTASTQAESSSTPTASPSPSVSPAPTCKDDVAFLNTVFAGYLLARTKFNTLQGQTTAKGQHAFLSSVGRLRTEVAARHVAQPLAAANHMLVLGFDRVLRGGRREFGGGTSITAMVRANNVLRAGDVMVARAKLGVVKATSSGTCS
jgi:hypothetical protein